MIWITWLLVALGGAAGPGVTALLGTGPCGALTTYSTFGYETLRPAERGHWAPASASANVVVPLPAAMGAVGAGLALTRDLPG